MPGDIEATLDIMAEHRERVSRLMFVDPVHVEAVARGALAAAARLLSFERWLDRVERHKGEEGRLSPAVERQVLIALGRAQEDAYAVSAGFVDLMGGLEAVGALEELVRVMAEAVRQTGETQARAGLEQCLPRLHEQFADLGLDSELLAWAFPLANLPQVVVSATEDTLEYKRMVRRGGGEVDRRVALGRNPSFIPVVDGRTFTRGGFYRQVRRDERAIGDGAGRISPWGETLNLAKSLIELYESRLRITAERGLVVLPTGIAPAVIGAIIVIAIIIVAVTLGILCNNGKISDGVCKIAFAVLIFALLIWCLSEGKPGPGPGDVGITCTVTTDPQPADA